MKPSRNADIVQTGPSFVNKSPPHGRPATETDHVGCPERVTILGCPVTRLDLEGFADLAEDCIRAADPHQISVVNAAKLVRMRRDDRLARSLAAADLVGADGVPVVWASRLLGTPLPGRVNGTDLMNLLLERGHLHGYRIFFLGARPAVLQEALETVRARYPEVVVAGSQHGYFDNGDESLIVEEIRDSGADILFIALPTPQKEIWAATHLRQMDVPVVHGVGGSFDVLAGAVARAPRWMQKSGLEWLFRLLREPGRLWKRYLFTNIAFSALLLKEVLVARVARRRVAR